MGPYYADAGPEDGILMYRDIVGSIEVFEAADRSRPIGTALCIGWDAAGSAVWRLIVPDAEVDGPWVIVDREYVSTSSGWRVLYRCDSRHDPVRPGWAASPARFRGIIRPGIPDRPRTGVQPSPP